MPLCSGINIPILYGNCISMWGTCTSRAGKKKTREKFGSSLHNSTKLLQYPLIPYKGGTCRLHKWLFLSLLRYLICILNTRFKHNKLWQDKSIEICLVMCLLGLYTCDRNSHIHGARASLGFLSQIVSRMLQTLSPNQNIDRVMNYKLKTTNLGHFLLALS